MFEFLRDLNKNNHKEWMDKHRNEYYEVRDFYIQWLNEMDIKLARVDPNYSPTTGKQAINRINNNLLFHPNKPVYKDHFVLDWIKRREKEIFILGLMKVL